MVDARQQLGTLQARFGPLLEVHLERALLQSGIDATLARMMAYQFGFTDADLQHVHVVTGKRFRPLLALLACDGVGGRWQEALPCAAAIEMLHNFSLVHDDIEDRDPVRHHRATVWRLWGDAQAINVGDAVFSAAFGIMLSAHPDSNIALELGRSFQRTAMRLTEGQYLDMSFEQRSDVAPDEYLHMIERKTGALIAFSLWSGAAVGGADPATQTALFETGIALGKAFQIRDDIAGIWSAEAETGKQPATDLVNRKKTLPVLMGFARSTSVQSDTLNAFFERQTDDVDAVQEILAACGARIAAETAGAVQLHAALEAIERAELAAAVRAQLISLAVALAS